MNTQDMVSWPFQAKVRSRDSTECKTVLMVGTSLSTMGGVRAVVQGYVDGGLFERFKGVYISTHVDGSPWSKMRAAVAGWARAGLALAKLDAPLVHVHTASRASFWRKCGVFLMARAAHRPYLLHLHGGEFMQFYEQECGRRSQRFIRHVLRQAALVVVLSDQWRERMLRICPDAKIEVLPNGVPLPDLAQRRAEERPRIVFLGNMSRGKGIYDLLHAFARVAHRFPEARLICAGGGSIVAARAMAARFDLAGRVDFPGWLDAEQKRRLLSTASLFVLPSYAEGLPMALLEAMSWGLPVIATPVGGVPQVVQHEANGLLVAPGNIQQLAAALATALEKPELRQSLGTAARRTIEERFCLDRSLEQLGRIYARFGMTDGGTSENAR
jgi:glycosyltransferase involved in cell wall biosynthesis